MSRGHMRLVFQDCANSDLYDLSDYVVSSNSGGMAWLVRRNAFSNAQRAQRRNIRNWCVGLSAEEIRQEIEDMKNEDDKSPGAIFRRDCLDEFLLELMEEQNT